MLEFLPDWIKALFGTGLMVFIFYYGFKMTNKKVKGSESSNNKTESKD